MKENSKKAEALKLAANIQTEAAQVIMKEATARLAKLKSGCAFIEKLAPLIPEGWKISYDCGQVCIDKPRTDGTTKNSPIEFQLVCQDIKRIMGIEGTRSFDDYGSGNGYLCGNFNIWENDGEAADIFKAGLQVRVRFGSPSCKITYREELVEAHVRKIAVVPRECLGVEQ
jgi:hypothetical protein